MHRPGTEFSEPVWLDGWDDQSLWGWELGNYFAAMIPNDATEEIVPHFFGQPFSHVSTVVVALGRLSRADPLSVCRALEVLPPQGPIPDETEILTLREKARSHSMGAYTAGQIGACDWLLGRAATCPGSGWTWFAGQRPDRSIIAAECEVNTGEMFLGPADPNAAYRHGVDEILGRIVARFK